MKFGQRAAEAMALAAILLLQVYAQTPATPAARALATFPAQQRAPGDPAVVARGKSLYSVSCQACHGVDLRGGDLGGPNLLRSQIVLSDHDGELIQPVIQGSRQSTGMPAVNMPAADMRAVATYIHEVVGSSRGQGSPPDNGAPPPNILIGNAGAGKTYFEAKCVSCHSVTGDLAGLATKYADPKTLQNRWLSGGGAGRGTPSERRTVTVSVTGASGEKTEGRLVRIDDFIVTLAAADGSLKTFRRDGDKPKVEVHDPMQAHRDLLAVYSDTNMHDVTAYLVTLK